MSLLLLIDGYNLVSPIAPPSRNVDKNWLHRERMLLIDRLAHHLDAPLRLRTCVVFDAANPPRNRSSEFVIEGINIRFAVDYPEADDLIEELIVRHHSPKQLTVVSSDHRIQAAARRRSATMFDSEPWLDALVDGNPQLGIERPGMDGAGQGTETEKPTSDLPEQSVSEWMKEFGFDE